MNASTDRKSLADQVAHLCYRHFDNLPKKGKPLQGREWTIVAAVVQRTAKRVNSNISLKIVSMGTGSKCVGQSKLSQDGDLLNDSHAEILARRGFLRYLYHHIEIAVSGKESDIFVVDPKTKKFLQREEVSFIFFSSHTPCGDASIIVKETNTASGTTEEVLQPTNGSVSNPDEEPPLKLPKLEMQDVHRTGAKCVEGGPQDLKHSGIDHHIVGALRTKPGRGDRTLSMSCSDKFAKWIILGIQGSLLMNFLLRPVYVSHIIIGKCHFSQSAMERALITRFESALNQMQNTEFRQHKPEISQSQLNFRFGKQVDDEECQMQPCPSSIIWCACPVKQLEVAVEGRKQGLTKKNQNQSSCYLEICKKNLFKKFLFLLSKFQVDDLPMHLKERHTDIQTMTYNQVKRLCTDYVQMWEKARVNILPTWTTKPTALTEFTVSLDS
ncbi:tRNA-specific adenosine deaminase 1 [Daphnia magna]|uniref:tRNA-specific adenosine deaminase 1 n=1 Tax=Daphnia magna TaxID=35525 RepID=A0A162PL27_9CRUS|nr:tRNA-specific adenosine deaminase 1 [Daphnia magna]